MAVVSDRIKALLDALGDEVKRTGRMNVTQRLEATYDEVKLLVGQLAGVPDGGKAG